MPEVLVFQHAPAIFSVPPVGSLLCESCSAYRIAEIEKTSYISHDSCGNFGI